MDLNALLQSNPLILTIVMAVIMASTLFYVTRNSGKSTDKLAEAITMLVTNEGNRDQRIQKLADKMEGLEPLARSIGELAAKIGAQTLENADNKKMMAELVGKLGFSNSLSNDWIERAKKAQEDAEKAMSEVAENNRKIDEFKKELESLKGAVTAFGQKLDTLIATNQGETAAIRSLKDTVEKLQQAFESQKPAITNTINLPSQEATDSKPNQPPAVTSDPKPADAPPIPPEVPIPSAKENKPMESKPNV